MPGVVRQPKVSNRRNSFPGLGHPIELGGGLKPDNQRAHELPNGSAATPCIADFRELGCTTPTAIKEFVMYLLVVGEAA
jgi:hypothetical protein